MGTTYEWHDTAHPFFAVQYLPPRHDVSTGEKVEDDGPIEGVTDADTLLIASDEVAVITGDLDKFLDRVLDAVTHSTDARRVLATVREWDDEEFELAFGFKREHPDREEDSMNTVRGCSCGMADYGAPGHDGHHPEHEECADGCGLDVTHNGACLDRPGGRQVCDHEEPDPTPVERWQVTTPPDVDLTDDSPAYDPYAGEKHRYYEEN